MVFREKCILDLAVSCKHANHITTSTNLHNNPSLVIQTIIVARISESISIARCTSRLVRFWEAEETAATRVLHALCESLVASDLNIANRSPSRLHGLFKVCFCKLGYGVISLDVLFHLCITSSLALLSSLDVNGDRFLDSELNSTLGNEAEIGTGETVCSGCDIVNVDVVCDGSLSKLCFENTGTGSLIREGNVYESIETTWTAEGVVQLLWTIRSSNNENVLFRCHSIHLCE